MGWALWYLAEMAVAILEVTASPMDVPSCSATKEMSDLKYIQTKARVAYSCGYVEDASCEILRVLVEGRGNV